MPSRSIPWTNPGNSKQAWCLKHKEQGEESIDQRVGFAGGSVVKNLTANAASLGSVSGSGRFPGEGKDNPLQSSCLEHLLDRLQSMGRKDLDLT